MKVQLKDTTGQPTNAPAKTPVICSDILVKAEQLETNCLVIWLEATHQKCCRGRKDHHIVAVCILCAHMNLELEVWRCKDHMSVLGSIKH